MTNVEYETKSLVREIRKSNEYNQYHRLRRRLSKDPELMRRVDDYRRACFELQVKEAEEDDEDKLIQLVEAHEDLLQDAVVNEFLISERRLCRMIRNITSAVTEAANLHLEL